MLNLKAWCDSQGSPDVTAPLLILTICDDVAAGVPRNNVDPPAATEL